MTDKLTVSALYASVYTLSIIFFHLTGHSSGQATVRPLLPPYPQQKIKPLKNCNFVTHAAILSKIRAL